MFPPTATAWFYPHQTGGLKHIHISTAEESWIFSFTNFSKENKEVKMLFFFMTISQSIIELYLPYMLRFLRPLLYWDRESRRLAWRTALPRFLQFGLLRDSSFSGKRVFLEGCRGTGPEAMTPLTPEAGEPSHCKHRIEQLILTYKKRLREVEHEYKGNYVGIGNCLFFPGRHS